MSDLKWYESPASDQNIIISSRVRLARNLKKYPFPVKLSEEGAARLIEDITGALEKETTEAPGGVFRRIDLEKAGVAEQNCLLENHMISPEFLSKQATKGLFVKADHSVGIMVNEEDHLRIQTIFPGDNIQDSYCVADRIDNLIEASAEYAFDKDFGYLTACPTNAGTGMRVSLMFHIPALEMTGQLMHLMNSIAKFGMTVRGLYGEGSKPLGSIYQISNQLTIGKSEKEIISILNNTAAKIIEQETALREKLFSDKSLELENRIYRSYGILSYCRKISAKEAMPMLSDLRLGLNAGILDVPRPKMPIYNIMMQIQPGNLEKNRGARGTETERDIFRAAYIQSCLKN
jgi:protein arginine kinase